MTSEGLGDRLAELENRVTALEAALARQALPFNEVAAIVEVNDPLAVNPPQAVVAITMKSKKFVAGEYGDDRIVMDLELTLDAQSRATRAVKGQLVFADLFGDPGLALGYTVNDPLLPGTPFKIKGVGFDYNQFMSDHNWMLNTELGDMVCYFEAKSIIYQDGTTQSF